NGFTLRTYTIQVFQEATNKMQKLMSALEEMEILKVDDLGEGRTRVNLFKVDLLFSFGEWYTEWLFKADKDRILFKEEELKALNAMIFFGKKLTPNNKGQVKLNLTLIQNESMKELGYLTKIDEFEGMIEKGVLGEKMMAADGITSTCEIPELERVYP